MFTLIIIDASDLWCRLRSYAESLSHYGIDISYLIQSVCITITIANSHYRHDPIDILLQETLWEGIYTDATLEYPAYNDLDAVDQLLIEAGELTLHWLERALQPYLTIAYTHQIALEYQGRNETELFLRFFIRKQLD